MQLVGDLITYFLNTTQWLMEKLTPIPEDELVAALKEHSQKAYSVLYDMYAPVLLGMICKVVKNSDAAENLLQETFMRVWREIDMYDAKKGRLFTWLLNMARTTAINFARSQRNEENTASQPLAEEVTIEPKIIPDASIVNRSSVEDTKPRLDPTLNHLIDLIYFNGYTQPEVADNLNMPLGTVKTHTQLALQQLKVLFNNAI